MEERLAGQRYLVGDTIDFNQIKKHYYVTHVDTNPSGIVPKGPDAAAWLAPHSRADLGGDLLEPAPRRRRP